MPLWLKGLSFLNSILSQFMSKNQNLMTKNKEEFMELSDGRIIRLDALISVDGKEFGRYC